MGLIILIAQSSGTMPVERIMLNNFAYTDINLSGECLIFFFWLCNYLGGKGFIEIRIISDVELLTVACLGLISWLSFRRQFLKMYSNFVKICRIF